MAAFRNLAYLFGSRSRPTFDDGVDDCGAGDDEAHGGDDGGCVRILHML